MNFCEFTELLVHQTHSSVLCDGHLMDTVIGMLSGLTNSAVYSLRHTSSLAGETLHGVPARAFADLRGRLGPWGQGPEDMVLGDMGPGPTGAGDTGKGLWG